MSPLHLQWPGLKQAEHCGRANLGLEVSVPQGTGKKAWEGTGFLILSLIQSCLRTHLFRKELAGIIWGTPDFQQVSIRTQGSGLA